jgi:hypothetical protein
MPDQNVKRDRARKSLNAISKAAAAKYGDNAPSYMSGYLESAMVEAMLNMSQKDFDNRLAQFATATVNLKV